MQDFLSTLYKLGIKKINGIFLNSRYPFPLTISPFLYEFRILGTWYVNDQITVHKKRTVSSGYILILLPDTLSHTVQ